MSEIEKLSKEPAGPPPDQSLLPLLPAPPPPAPPAGNSFWHRLAAGVVVAAVVAAAAGAGIGWSLARAINPRVSTVPTISQPQTNPEAPIQATKPSTGAALDANAIAAKVNTAIVDINTTLGGGAAAAGTGVVISSSDLPELLRTCDRIVVMAEGRVAGALAAGDATEEGLMALATGLRTERDAPPPGVPVTGRDLDAYFAAVVEATEEAVLTSLLMSPTVFGRDGNTSAGLPFAEVVRLLEEHRG